MTATFAHLQPESQQPFGLSQLKAIIVEPFLVVATCVFWIAVLPVTGIFCAGVAVYDKVASLRAPEIRLPDLRSNPGANPLVLRRKAVPGNNAPVGARSGAQTT
ncbi:MAG: hypothetical protein ABI787_04075 [Spartobacteria bacterium]